MACGMLPMACGLWPRRRWRGLWPSTLPCAYGMAPGLSPIAHGMVGGLWHGLWPTIAHVMACILWHSLAPIAYGMAYRPWQGLWWSMKTHMLWVVQPIWPMAEAGRSLQTAKMNIGAEMMATCVRTVWCMVACTAYGMGRGMVHGMEQFT